MSKTMGNKKERLIKRGNKKVEEKREELKERKVERKTAGEKISN